jgi:hypothetical protein
MKKLLGIMVLGLLLSGNAYSKDTFLICDERFFVLKKNGKQLIEKASVTTLFDIKIKNDETIFKKIFQNDRIYIFNHFKHPYSRFYLIDRDTLKMAFKLYYTDRRVFLGQVSPKPPKDISILANEIYDHNVIKQCVIKSKPKI